MPMRNRILPGRHITDCQMRLRRGVGPARLPLLSGERPSFGGRQTARPPGIGEVDPTIIGRPINPLAAFTLCPFSGINGECLANAPYRCRPCRSSAHRTGPITDDWPANFATSPGKLGCR
jgi:hypothetical protein